MGNGQSHDDSDSGTEDELSGSEEEDEELEDEEDGKASPNNEPDGKASPEKSGKTSFSRENAAALLPGKPADAADSGNDAREGGAGGGEGEEKNGNGGRATAARGRHGGEVGDAGSTFGAVAGSGGAADTVENTESGGNAGDWDLAWDDETDEEKEKAEGKAERKAEGKAEEGKTAQTAKDGEREEENNAGATGSEATVAAATATAAHPSLLSATAAAVAAAAGSADPAAAGSADPAAAGSADPAAAGSADPAAAGSADPAAAAAAASTTTPPAPLVPVAAAATASSSPSPTAAAVKSAEGGSGGMARAWDEFAEGKGASSFMDASRPLSSHPFMHGPAMPRADICTEFYIIRHGEAAHNVSTLIGGRSPQAALTPLGEQQAVLLGRYLRDYVGVRFHAIFSSPIERSKRTAILACQEMGVAESMIRYADELQELSQGQWERQPRARIYQRGVLEQMVAAQPDFRAPGGESQRQVEFRMVEFVSNILFVRQHLEALASTPSAPPSTTYHPASAPPSNLPTTPANGNSSTPASANSSTPASANSSSSNLSSSTGSAVNAQGGGAAADDVFRVAVFSHGTAIRCLVRGVLGSDPHLTHNIGIDNTSISILRHTARKGWHLVKMNDTTHLILARGPLGQQDASS